MFLSFFSQHPGKAVKKLYAGVWGQWGPRRSSREGSEGACGYVLGTSASRSPANPGQAVSSGTLVSPSVKCERAAIACCPHRAAGWINGEDAAKVHRARAYSSVQLMLVMTVVSHGG